MLVQKYYALHPDFFDGLNDHEAKSDDAMHLEADGNLPCKQSPNRLLSVCLRD